MIKLYAITDHPGPPLPDMGPLRAVAAGAGLAVVCAPADEDELSPEALWRHEEVVEALMESRDLLPVRYGTRLEDEAAAARAVEERQADLSDALDRVRGAVELSLRVLSADEPPAASGDVPPEAAADVGGAGEGIEYLRAKARSAAARDAVSRAVHEPLRALARANAQSAPHAEAEVLRAAYLVERDLVPAFSAAVARLQAENPRLRLLCTGPWPPYSFAER